MFVLMSQIHVGSDEFFDNIGHFILRKRWADHFAKRRTQTLRAANCYLVELRTVLVHAENADVTDVMMSASIHAAGNIDGDIADVE